MSTPVRIVIGKALSRAIEYPEVTDLYVASPAEAIRAMDSNTRGRLRRYLYGEGSSRYYRVSIGHSRNDLTKEELTGPSGHQTIYLLPVIRGRKSGGAKIIAAVALAALTYGASVAFEGAAWIGTATTIGYSTAASLALGGITQLLTPNPSFNQNSDGDSRGSNILGGNATAVTQGGAVGLVYGRAMVTPMPISVSFTAYDQPIAGAASMAPATATTTYGKGGIVNQDIIPPDPVDNLPA